MACRVAYFLLAAGGPGVLPLAVTTDPVVYQGVTVPWWLPIAILGTVTAALAYVAGIAATRLPGSRAAARRPPPAPISR